MPAKASPATAGTATATAAAPVSGRVSEATAAYSTTHTSTIRRSSGPRTVTQQVFLQATTSSPADLATTRPSRVRPDIECVSGCSRGRLTGHAATGLNQRTGSGVGSGTGSSV